MSDLTFVSAPGATSPGASLRTSRANVPPPSGAAAPSSQTEGGNGASYVLAAALATAPVMAAGIRRQRRRTRLPRNFDPSTGEATVEDIKNADFFAVAKNTKAYKEQDRRFRRPVFGYGDWVNHRSADRFTRNLSTIFVSRIAKAIWLEVLAPTAAAVAVLFYYDLDWSSLWQALSLSAPTIETLQALPTFTVTNLPFTLCSPALSLLLVFKTNAAYGRWWEARKVWGSIVNKTRDLVRQSLARIPQSHEHMKAEITRLTASYPYIVAFHLSEQTPAEVERLQTKLDELCTEEEAEEIMAAVHKPMTVSGMLSSSLQRSGLDTFDKLKLDNILSDFADYYGMCERIFKTPIPLSYTRLTGRFLSVWLLCMPFALYSAVSPHWLIVPITFFVASFIFGIEELGMQIEEPFSYLPLEKISNGIEASLYEALELNSTAPLTPHIINGGDPDENLLPDIE